MDKDNKSKLPENHKSFITHSSDKLKRDYVKPRLQYYGGIKELTHSSTVVGTGDSSNPGTRRA